METGGIESFLRITGPWGLVGILIFVMWDMVRKNEKSLREILTTQALVLDHLTTSVTKLETRMESVDQNQRELVAQLSIILRVKPGN